MKKIKCKTWINALLGIFYTLATLLEFFFNWTFSSPCENQNHGQEFGVILFLAMFKLILVILYMVILNNQSKGTMIYCLINSILIIGLLYPLPLYFFEALNQNIFMALKDITSPIINLISAILIVIYLYKNKN